MKYLLLQYGNETAMLNLPKEEAGRMHAAYMAYTEAMKKAGVLLGNSGLRPTSEATTVRARGGKLVAFLAARTRDVAGAVDALSEAYRRAIGLESDPAGRRFLQAELLRA